MSSNTIPTIQTAAREGERTPPVVAVRAIPAEAYPEGQLAVVDCTQDVGDTGHPPFAVMAPFDKSKPPEDVSGYAPLLLDGLPQMYDTAQQAMERIRYFQHAKKHGAMLTLGGLKNLVDALEKRGVPMSAPVCMPILGGGEGTMAVVRCGGAHVLRLQSQHERNGQVMERNALRPLVVFDCGVFPPEGRSVNDPQAALAPAVESDNDGGYDRPIDQDAPATP